VQIRRLSSGKSFIGKRCGADDICANKHTQSMTLVEAHDDTSDDEYDNGDYY